MNTVLIVEDNAQLCSFYSRIVGHLGITVVEVHSCRAAMEFLHYELPRLILLDMCLPDGTGESIINYVRAQANNEHTKIAMLTGDSQYKKLAAKMPVDAFLEKPVTSPALLEMVGRLMEQHAVA
jgi:two-component system, repressor protein LuxO